MNIGITTSFLVGGLLLLSILHMNFTVSNNSAQTTLQVMAKNRMMAVTQTLNGDFGRMGFNVPPSADVITSFDATSIAFRADTDGNGTDEAISWAFNSSDSTLVRTGPVSTGSGSVASDYPVAEFRLRYYDGNQNIIDPGATSDPTNIRKIEIELLCESPEGISQNSSHGAEGKVYGRSYWHKTIVPPSIQFRQN